jgi:hypothetical protein
MSYLSSSSQSALLAQVAVAEVVVTVAIAVVAEDVVVAKPVY